MNRFLLVRVACAKLQRQFSSMSYEALWCELSDPVLGVGSSEIVGLNVLHIKI